MNVRLEIPEDLGRLPHDMELAIFRIVQESLTNVHRHSQAKNARIRLLRSQSTLSLGIQDDGQGIPADKLAEVQSQGAGLGLRGMRERIRQFRGEMKIDSNDQGTGISIAFPLPAPERSETAVERRKASTV